jgi:hypothetical protein
VSRPVLAARERLSVWLAGRGCRVGWSDLVPGSRRLAACAGYRVSWLETGWTGVVPGVVGVVVCGKPVELGVVVRAGTRLRTGFPSQPADV